MFTVIHYLITFKLLSYTHRWHVTDYYFMLMEISLTVTNPKGNKVKIKYAVDIFIF